jgi:RimJ/RimL family protein N-acetyltransferase
MVGGGVFAGGWLMVVGGLATERLLMRRWRDTDLTGFADLNADAEVMRYFPSLLTQAQSDLLVGRIEQHFEEHGFGLWALEVAASGEFIGFTGLIWQTFPAPFTPAVEVGWRLARAAWGHGYASEAAGAALGVGFDEFGLREIVSMTAIANTRSRRVMERIGMTHDPAYDFLHPNVPEGSPVRAHVLYRIAAPD